MIRSRIAFLLYHRLRLANRGVVTALSSFCDSNTIFEGRNRITSGAVLLHSKLGLATYVGTRATLTKANIGRFTCIGPGVETIVGSHPASKFVSTHPAFFSSRRQAGFTFVERDLYPEFGERTFEEKYLFEIGSDVWIGHGARLMQGIRIGDGAIVGAGSLVTKDVPPYAIVAGIPARVLRYRFSPEIIQRLCTTAWWKLDLEDISGLSAHFSDPESLLCILESRATRSG